MVLKVGTASPFRFLRGRGYCMPKKLCWSRAEVPGLAVSKMVCGFWFGFTIFYSDRHTL